MTLTKGSANGNITFNTQCDDSQQKRLNYRNNESTFIDGTEEVTRQRMVVRVVVHKVGGISQHKVKISTAMIKQITITQPADLMPLKEAAFFE